jgi:hypothetical protein
MIHNALKTNTIEAKESDEISSHYLFRDDVAYPQRLANLIDALT